MRALPPNLTLVSVAVMLAWALVRAARFGVRGAPSAGDLPRRILSRRAMPVFLAGACANIAFSALTGYINPRDYVQDVVAARQFLRHETMYPQDLPRMGTAELSAAIPGREVLRRLPIVHDELNSLTEAPAPANAHPPLVGIVLAVPVLVLGLRGSFVLVLLLSIVLMYLTMAAILHELFMPLRRVELYALMGLVFGWYPVGAALRSGQPAIVLFALITAGWLMLRRNRPWIAGAAIGLAACIHAFPALFLLYFAIRWRRALVAGLGTIALLTAAAAGLTTRGTFRQWLNTADALAQRFVPRVGNLSVAGQVTTFCRGAGWSVSANAVAPVMLLVIAVALAVFLRPWNRGNLGLERLDAEYSVFAAAMLLASPMSWVRYLPIMLLPVAVVIRNWRQRPPAWAPPALLAALLFLSVPDATLFWAYGWLARNLGFAAAWLGAAMSSLSILAILFWLRSPRSPAAGADRAAAWATPKNEGREPAEIAS